FPELRDGHDLDARLKPEALEGDTQGALAVTEVGAKSDICNGHSYSQRLCGACAFSRPQRSPHPALYPEPPSLLRPLRSRWRAMTLRWWALLRRALQRP